MSNIHQANGLLDDGPSYDFIGESVRIIWPQNISVRFIVPFEVAILSAADILVYGLLSWCMDEPAMPAATRVCAALFSSA